MRWRRKAGAIRYLGNGLTRFLQKREPTLESAENDVPMRCHARLLAECPDEVIDAQACGAGQLVQRWRRDCRVDQGGDDQVVYSSVCRASKAATRGLRCPAKTMVQEPGPKTTDAGFEEE